MEAVAWMLVGALVAAVAVAVLFHRPCPGRWPVPHSHPGGVLCLRDHCPCGECPPAESV